MSYRLLACCVIPVLVAVTGCRSARPLAADDLSAPGWKVRQGQAVWKTGESELAGEVIIATREDGGSSIQFIKTPLPLVSAQRRGTRWTARFYADNRTIAGRGTPPIQVLWLHLAQALDGRAPPKPLEFKGTGGGDWELRNVETGESISGFLNP